MLESALRIDHRFTIVRFVGRQFAAQISKNLISEGLAAGTITEVLALGTAAVGTNLKLVTLQIDGGKWATGHGGDRIAAKASYLVGKVKGLVLAILKCGSKNGLTSD